MSGGMQLAARNVHFAYSPGAPVLRGASLALARGAMGALIGPNGCGKSTLIRLLAGLLGPSEGEVLLDGRPLAAIDRRSRTRKIAYVPQTTAKAFPFTAFEVVLTGRVPHLPRFAFESAADAARALEALETAGVAHLAGRRITELSAGERQLVSVARALAQDPECILLDEPSASLDLKHRAGLVRTLAGLRDRRGLTVLMVTHDLSLLDPGFDVVFAMRGGIIAAVGPPAEALREPVLAEVYEDEHVRVRRAEGRTFVWSEV
jgi:iron complex transport system ATP-binding protein